MAGGPTAKSQFVATGDTFTFVASMNPVMGLKPHSTVPIALLTGFILYSKEFMLEKEIILLNHAAFLKCYNKQGR